MPSEQHFFTKIDTFGTFQIGVQWYLPIQKSIARMCLSDGIIRM